MTDTPCTPKGMRAVYCCCECNLLGYLPKRGRAYDLIRFAVKPDDVLTGLESIEILDFEVESLYLTLEYRVVAYKSRDYPIEKLRRIPGWVDA